jgi:uncharacterized protein YycO
MSYPGRIGLTHIHGEVGKLIEFGQFLNGTGFNAWEHAYMDLGDGTLIQAEPGKAGAQIRPLDIYADSDVYWCDNIYQTMTEIQRIDAAYWGRMLAGTPYSFIDYGALFFHRMHVWVPGLKGYIASSDHMICSQLVDTAYSRAGVHLFDNRWPGYVTPGDLYVLDKRQELELDLVACGACGQLGYCLYCRPRRHHY